uniref:SHR-BD domain-containing protein n=1 Tax=Macrostomum lignano TaxID=282301 RepID=A0A1I8FBH8_9PLAT
APAGCPAATQSGRCGLAEPGAPAGPPAAGVFGGSGRGGGVGGFVGQLGRINRFGDGVGWFGGRRRAGAVEFRHGALLWRRSVETSAPSQTPCLAAAVSASTRSIEPLLGVPESEPTCVLFFSDLTPDSPQATPSGSICTARRPHSSTTGSGGIPRSVSTLFGAERSQAMRLLHMTGAGLGPGGGASSSNSRGVIRAHRQGCSELEQQALLAVGEIVLIDLLINQPVASIALERSAAGFLRVHSCDPPGPAGLPAGDRRRVSLRLRRPGCDEFDCVAQTDSFKVPGTAGWLMCAWTRCSRPGWLWPPPTGRVAFWELTAQPAARRLAAAGEPPSEPSASPESISAGRWQPQGAAAGRLSANDATYKARHLGLPAPG